MSNSKEHPISELVESTLQSLRQLVSANAIVGEPIRMGDDVTIVPISKISFGYGTGGSDIPSKYAGQNTGFHFGGGGGGGATVEPIAFIIMQNGEIRVQQIATADNTADRIVNMVPQVFDKVSGLINESKAKKSAQNPTVSDLTGTHAE